MAIGLFDVPEFNKIFIALLLLVVATIFARFINSTSQKYFYRITRKLKIDETTFLLFQRLIIVSIYIFTLAFIVYFFESLRNLSYALLAGAGFIGIIIGFAAQSTISNIISGLIIGMTRPFRVGDYIDIKEDYGMVEDITLRHTVIKTWDNRRLIIPNSVINTETINNWSIIDTKIMWSLKFRIDYTADIEKARSIIREEISKNKYTIKTKEIKIYLSETTDFYMVLTALYWVKDRPSAWVSGNIIREETIKRFKEEEIKIPLPIRHVYLKEDGI